MRLDRFLSGQNVASRKEAKELARAGLIRVNDTVVKDTGMNIDPENDRIAVRGEVISYKEYLYLFQVQ